MKLISLLTKIVQLIELGITFYPKKITTNKFYHNY